MLDRIAFDGQQGKISWSWTWTFATDEARFRPYYEFFASVTPKPESGDLQAVYADFAAHHIAILQAKEAREKKKKDPGTKTASKRRATSKASNRFLNQRGKALGSCASGNRSRICQRLFKCVITPRYDQGLVEPADCGRIEAERNP